MEKQSLIRIAMQQDREKRQQAGTVPEQKIASR
jgi:hypothetical protein